MQKLKMRSETSLLKWSLERAKELYNIREWGKGFFDINDRGNIVIMPNKDKTMYVDLRELIEDLKIRGLSAPLLIRFTGILKKRIEEIQSAFSKAIKEYEYKGNITVFIPLKLIKVDRLLRI